jgi:hypothetical protein
MSVGLLWSRSVPIPLSSDMFIGKHCLPKPKPDYAFGYSELAFTVNQLRTIGLLVDDTLERNYAMPHNNLRFPFLSIEFKSQAMKGTHYVAANQVAGAGAIALNGYLELMRRISRVEELDTNQPQFFSASIDHELMRIYVHWLRGGPHEDVPYSFHVETVARYWLDSAEELRGALRAIQNIIDYSLDTRLKGICEALDAYQEVFLAAREAGAAYR